MRPPSGDASHRPLRGVATPLLLAGALLAGACGGPPREPAPPPPAPDLTGVRVMLIPVPATDPEALNAELTFWLTQRAPTTDWVPPDELERIVDRAPAWRVRLNTLPRAIVDAGGRERQLMDATYAELRRLGAMADATVALMPMGVRRQERAGAVVMELTAAIVDIRGGRVVWVGSVHAPVGVEAGDSRIADLAEALARALFPL